MENNQQSTFNQWIKSPQILRSLQEHNWIKPTPIQQKCIPLLLSSKDLVGSAQTGTGKTLAFLLPVVAKMMKEREKATLILTPTRELAQQIYQTLGQILKYEPQTKFVSIVGGLSLLEQKKLLSRKPQIIISTPGRLIDHLHRKHVDLFNVSCLVLDEADLMLDMGFFPQVQEILKHIPERRQSMLFSATFSPEVDRFISKVCFKPQRVQVGSANKVIHLVEQKSVVVKESDKQESLVDQLFRRQGQVIVFTRTKYGAEKLNKFLIHTGHSSERIHGDRTQHQRQKALENFRNKDVQILVATDVASRGIDVSGVECVINFDLPMNSDDYLHRVGRTGRAGVKGEAISLVTHTEKQKFATFQSSLNTSNKK